MHQAQDKAGLWPYAMDIAGSYSKDWQISHGLAHHLDTNLETDWEYVQLGVPDIRERNNAKGFGFLAAPLFMGLALQASSVAYLVDTVREAAANKADGKQWHHLLSGLFPPVQMLAYMYGSRSVRKGLALYCVQMAAFVLVMVPMAGGTHHAAVDPDSRDAKDFASSPKARATYAWREGQPGAQSDWGAHQVSTSTEHSLLLESLPPFVSHWLQLTLYGYLNAHTLHHLFPGVDHSRLHLLRGVLEETAEEFGLDREEVKSQSPLALIKGFWRYHLQRKLRSRL